MTAIQYQCPFPLLEPLFQIRSGIYNEYSRMFMSIFSVNLIVEDDVS